MNADDIGAAFFTNDETIAGANAGSGGIPAFVRIKGNAGDEIEGYNTSGRPVQFDENTSPTFTHDVRTVDIPIVYDLDD